MERLAGNLLPWFMLAVFSSATLSAVVFLAERQRFFPLGVGLAGVFVALLELATPRLGFLRKRFTATHTMDLGLSVDDLPPATVDKRVVQVLAWLTALVLLVYLLGFRVGTAAFMLIYLRWVRRSSWTSVLLLTATVWAGLFVAIDRIIYFSWPEPALLMLFQWLRS